MSSKHKQHERKDLIRTLVCVSKVKAHANMIIAPETPDKRVDFFSTEIERRENRTEAFLQDPETGRQRQKGKGNHFRWSSGHKRVWFPKMSRGGQHSKEEERNPPRKGFLGVGSAVSDTCTVSHTTEGGSGWFRLEEEGQSWDLREWRFPSQKKTVKRYLTCTACPRERLDLRICSGQDQELSKAKLDFALSFP